MKISITRALSSLKTSKDRYDKLVAESRLIGVKTGGKMAGPYVSYTPEDFEKQARETYQAIIDLGKQIITLKTKIDLSNYVTKVRIGDKEMTVLEAIRMKDQVSMQETLLCELKSQLARQRKIYENTEVQNQARVEKIVSEQTAAGSKDKDLEEEAINKIGNLYKVAWVDPIGAESVIEKLEKEISDFKSEVDFVLSESNSTNFIEID